MAVTDTIGNTVNQGTGLVRSAWSKVIAPAAFTYGAVRIYAALSTGGATALADLAQEGIKGLAVAAHDFGSAAQFVSGKLAAAKIAAPAAAL